MEELLNKLIEKGWKPRNKEETKRMNYHTLYREVISLEFDNYNLPVSYSIRDLVSKESGLWQFCCKNRLTNRDGDWSKNAERDEDGVIDRDCLIFSSDYEYRLIESALKDEDELEEFLLSNIDVEGK